MSSLFGENREQWLSLDMAVLQDRFPAKGLSLRDPSKAVLKAPGLCAGLFTMRWLIL